MQRVYCKMYLFIDTFIYDVSCAKSSGMSSWSVKFDIICSDSVRYRYSADGQ